MVESDPTNSELATFDPKTEGGAFRVVSVEERTNFSGIKLYPNPTTGSSTLTFSSEVNDNAVVRVISVTGQEMVNFSNDVNVGDNVIQVDMTSFESGYYFVEVTGETGVITRQQVLKK